MSSFWKLVVGALACLPIVAAAQSPYQVSGLHTDLVFSDAVAQVEKLGGACKAVPAQEGGSEVHCEFRQCASGSQDGPCKEGDTKAPALSIAAQPVLRIALEAPAAQAPLSRIIFLFDGSTAPVAEFLTREFGPPTNPGAPADAKSWSHSRRVSWTQGIYRMGLLNSPNLLILAADRVSPAPAVDATTNNPPAP